MTKKYFLLLFLLITLFCVGCVEENTESSVPLEEKNDVENRDAVSLYRDFFYENYKSENCNVFLADVRPGGDKELIVVEQRETSPEYEVVIYSIEGKEPRDLWSDTAGTSQVDMTGYFLSQGDAGDRIVAYSPHVSNGIAEETFRVFQFTDSGEIDMIDDRTVAYIADEANPEYIGIPMESEQMFNSFVRETMNNCSVLVDMYESVNERCTVSKAEDVLGAVNSDESDKNEITEEELREKFYLALDAYVWYMVADTQSDDPMPGYNKGSYNPFFTATYKDNCTASELVAYLKTLFSEIIVSDITDESQSGSFRFLNNKIYVAQGWGGNTLRSEKDLSIKEKSDGSYSLTWTLFVLDPDTWDPTGETETFTAIFAKTNGDWAFTVFPKTPYPFVSFDDV